MASEKIIDALNEDRSEELSAILQYMGHHYLAKGIESAAIQDMFKAIAIDEMKHAEKLAERIQMLGGIPTVKPGVIKQGGDIRQMIRDDLAGEESAVARYKEHIKLCDQEGDPATRLMLEEILTDEEEHVDTWETLLG